MKIFQLLGNVLSCGGLDLLRNRPAALRYWRRVAGAMGEPGNRSLRLPAGNLVQLVDGAEKAPVTLCGHVGEYGEVLLEEMIALCRLVRALKPGRIFEIGTFRGATALHLAANSDAEVFTLDLPPEAEKPLTDPSLDVYPEDPGCLYRGSPYAARIRQLHGDSRTFDYSPYQGTIDLVFVDGNHHYEFVLQDSRSALEMLAEGGRIIWHDYAPHAPGVVRVLHELNRSLRLWHLEGTSLVLLEPGGRDG